MSRKRDSVVQQSSSVSAYRSALEHFRNLLSPQSFANLLSDLEHPLYPAIRLNPFKATPKDLFQWSVRYSWQLEPVPFCALGWWVKEANVPVSQTMEHRFGYYYIQEAASMLPAELFDFKSLDHPLILDMAASPGGKTTHLISRSEDRGLVIANDSSAARLTALRLVLQNWGAVNVAVTNFPGERFGSWFPEMFDAVLLDAPCSMQGLRSSETHPMRPISDREQNMLVQRQTRLLESALRTVRVGGQVVYATCTLTPEENEGVLDSILKRFGNAVRIEDVNRWLPVPAPGLTSDEHKRYDPQVERGVRLWPHLYHTAGFFSALLTKVSPINGGKRMELGLSFSLQRVGFLPLEKRKIISLTSDFEDNYGFDLDSLLAEYDLSLWHRREIIYVFPNRYLREFSNLPVHALGMVLGQETPQGFVPSHEWVTRFYPKFTRGHYQLPDEYRDAWLRGEDLRNFCQEDYPSGRIVLMHDAHSRFLGLGKVTLQRLKNLLPRRVVI